MLYAIKKLERFSDRTYLDALYQTYYTMLKNLAFYILQNEEAAADAVTDAMLSLFSLVPKLRAMEDWELTAYLRTTVRRAAYKKYKALKRRSATELPLEDSILFSLFSHEAAPEEAAIQNEEFQLVREAVATLPERNRQLLYLKYAAGLGAEEIGDLTGETAASLRMRLSRARRKVLRILEDRGWKFETTGFKHDPPKGRKNSSPLREQEFKYLGKGSQR